MTGQPPKRPEGSTSQPSPAPQALAATHPVIEPISQSLEASMQRLDVPVDENQRMLRVLRGQSVILELVRQLSLVTDLPLLLQSATDAALQIFGAQRATVWVHEQATKELFTLVGHGLRQPIRIPDNRGIAGEVFQTRQLINIPDATIDPRVLKVDGFVTQSMLSVPLISFDGSAVGVLQVLNRTGGAFDSDDERLATALGAQIGVSLQRHVLMEQFAAKKKLENDLRLAREIQQSLLPKQDPRIARYEIHGWNRPCDETGGDTYDFLELPNGMLAMMVCDATGHGVGPAIIVAQCRAILRAVVSLTSSPSLVLERANHLLTDDLPETMFITSYFAVLDSHRDTLHWSSAGQGPMLFLDARSERLSEYVATGPMLGIMPSLQFPEGPPQPFNVGDVAVILTDGFFEWPNPDGEQFGVQRVYHVFRQNRHRPLPEIVAAMVTEVERFAQGIPQRDDLTALVIRRNA